MMGVYSILYPGFNLNIPILNSWLCLTIENKKDEYNSKKIISIFFAWRMHSQLITQSLTQTPTPPKPTPTRFSFFLGSGPFSAPTTQLLIWGMCRNGRRARSQQIIHLWIIKNVCHTSLTMSVLSCSAYVRDPSYPRWISKQNEKPRWSGHVPTHVFYI